MEAGLVVGFVGVVIAVASAVYARAQAVATHAQAEEARRQSELARAVAHADVSQTMMEQLLAARMGFTDDPALARLYVEANPAIANVDPAMSLTSIVRMRNLVDLAQEAFYMRKSGVASEAVWRLWVTSLLPIARIPLFRRFVDALAERGALTPEFLAAARELVEGRWPADPVAPPDGTARAHR